jgi:hypothetical protein
VIKRVLAISLRKNWIALMRLHQFNSNWFLYFSFFRTSITFILLSIPACLSDLLLHMHLSCAPRVLRVIVRLHLSDAILRTFSSHPSILRSVGRIRSNHKAGSKNFPILRPSPYNLSCSDPPRSNKYLGCLFSSSIRVKLFPHVCTVLSLNHHWIIVAMSIIPPLYLPSSHILIFPSSHCFTFFPSQ